MEQTTRINEIWTLRINPSDLFNIERPKEVNPESGGGHTYIQIPKGRVADTLDFLRASYPPNGVPILLSVGSQSSPSQPPEVVEFYNKSSERMRIAKQNRHRFGRLSAWSPSSGFPSLAPNQTTEDATALLRSLGGLHIYLARTEEGQVWAGFTTGAPSRSQENQPFANILWGASPGGHWKYE
jgi:hypothetical protein